MSKIKVQQIEPNSSNSDLTITPNGAGIFEIIGKNNGTLQLNSINNINKVKIKSPPNSAAQNYTMILPTSSPAANTYLKVDSISGNGSSAIGQLEFATPAAADLTQLNANNFTSGTIAADRYNLTGSKGAGLQLIQKAEPSVSTSTITFSNLENGGMYRLLMNTVGNDTGRVKMEWLDSSGNSYSSKLHYGLYRVDAIAGSSWASSQNDDYYERNVYESVIDFKCDTSDSLRYYFECEIGTGIPTSSYIKNNFMIAKGLGRGIARSKVELFAGFMESAGAHQTTDRIYGIKIYFADGSTARTFESGTKILLYKYNQVS